MSHLKSFSKFIVLIIVAAIVGGGVSYYMNKNMQSTASKPADQKQTINDEIHEYLMSNPQIIMEMVQKLRQKQAEKMQQQAKGTAKIILNEHAKIVNDSNAVTEGNANAPITIVEFYDYQCVACAGTYPQMQKFLDTDFAKKNVRVVYRAFPFFGDASVYASKAVIAAKAQGKAIALHNALFKSGLIEGKLTIKAVDKMAQGIKGMNMSKLKADMKSKAVTDEMQANSDIVKSIKLPATPAFVFTPTNTKLANSSNTTFVNSGLPTQAIMSNAQQTLKNMQ